MGAHSRAREIGRPAWFATPIRRPPSRLPCSTQSGTSCSSVFCSTAIIGCMSFVLLPVRFAPAFRAPKAKRSQLRLGERAEGVIKVHRVLDAEELRRAREEEEELGSAEHILFGGRAGTEAEVDDARAGVAGSECEAAPICALLLTGSAASPDDLLV